MNYEKKWLAALLGKTIRAVRPVHLDGESVPTVNLLFTDDTAATVSVLEGSYFETCMPNSLRRSQPIADVVIESETTGYTAAELTGLHTVQILSKDAPLLRLSAVNKSLTWDQFPFELVEHRHG